MPVLKIVDGERIYVSRDHLPKGDEDGDIVELLPEDEWEGDVRYELDMALLLGI